VRAEEALDMLQAMNTGHDGFLTTIHANFPRHGLGHLEVMAGMANANMGVRSIRQQIAATVHLFVRASRFSDGTRRITHISEVAGMEQDMNCSWVRDFRMAERSVSLFCAIILSVDIHSEMGGQLDAEFSAGTGSRALQNPSSTHHPRRSAHRFDLRGSSPLRKTNLPLRQAE
jgi:hypothetical protein